MQPRSLASQLADVLAGGGWRSKARPEQLPPPGDWNGWLVMAGRGLVCQIGLSTFSTKAVSKAATGRPPMMGSVYRFRARRDGCDHDGSGKEFLPPQQDRSRAQRDRH